jgi:DNA-binding response OmpR family regulator
MVEIDTVFPSIKVDGREIMFSPIQFKLFIFLYNNRNKRCTRDNILDNVWGLDKFVGGRAVDVHIGFIRRHLIGTSLEGKVEGIRGFGYMLNYTEPETIDVGDSEHMDIVAIFNRPQLIDLEVIH